MNNPLDNILKSAGLNPADFTSAAPQPVLSATADPQAIREALSRKDTVYAAIQEDDSPESEPEIIEDALILDDGQPDACVRLSDSDFDDILSSVGFHADTPVEDAAQLQQYVHDLQSAVQAHDDNDGNDENEEESETADNAEPVSTVSSENDNGGSAGTLLKPNSPTLLVDDTTSRFSGAEWYYEIRKSKIILAGLGGIGSWTALCLARMCPLKIVLYDDDMVEAGNMSGQLFARSQIGQTKTASVLENITDFTAMTHAYSLNHKFTSADEPSDIMICGFDSMSARHEFFNAWVQHLANIPGEQRKNCLFIDGRLSIDTLQVLAVCGDDNHAIKTYSKEWLFSDAEAEPTVCSLKQTSYMACMIGAVITNLFTNFIANSLSPALPYDVPFLTEYDSQNMIFKTIV